MQDTIANPSYSLEEILQMSQDQINQRVFTFRNSRISLHDQEEYSELLEAIQSAANMKGISREFLPNFLYFQIKKCRFSNCGKEGYTL